MFGSTVLDVGIGMALLFAFASLICSALREAVETVMKSRAMDLERAIRELLRDYDGTGVAKRFYESPFISALFAGDYDPTKLKEISSLPGIGDRKVMPRKARDNLPAYIPSEAFAAAVIDLIHVKGGGPLSMASLRAGAGKIQNEGLRRIVAAAIDQAQDDLGHFQKTVEDWYDATMERATSWYKRRTQMILLIIGLLAAFLFNIDAVTVARHMSTDKAYRDFVVAKAGELTGDKRAALSSGSPEAKPGAKPADGAATPAPARSAEAGPQAQLAIVRQELVEAGFALGWPAPQFSGREVWSGAGLLILAQMIAGWCVTALAVSLGAPFWFDLMDKFISIRSAVKPLPTEKRRSAAVAAAAQEAGIDATAAAIATAQTQPRAAILPS